jgi:ABC-type branched-subunit amino acid transport system ATPase component
MRSTDIALRLEDVFSGYGENVIVKGASVSLPRGSWTTVIGANGAGKSTLLRTVAGSVACRSGSITVDGNTVSDWTALKRLVSGIGLVPQGRCNFPAMSVLENLKLGAFAFHLPRMKLEQEVERIFQVFPRLKERAGVLAGNLSGGEQQLLEMGMVLMTHPQLLLIDEPSLGLSPAATQTVFAEIRKLTQDGVTVLMVEQNACEALAECDDGIVMELGKVSLHAPASEVLAHPEIRTMFLGL